MRLFVRVIQASDTSMSLDYGDCLAQRRRGAEKRAFQSLSSSHPAGAQTPAFPVSLSASAPLREMSAAWIRLRRCGGSGPFGFSQVVATTAMRLVRSYGSNPGLSSFFGQPLAWGLNAVGVGRPGTQRRERYVCSLGDLGVSA